MQDELCPTDKLVIEYQNWTAKRDLQPMSADELLVETDENDEEFLVQGTDREWLRDYISRWEKIADCDHSDYDEYFENCPDCGMAA